MQDIHVARARCSSSACSTWAAEVIVTVFADKGLGKVKPVEADIIGLSIPNRFVVGFGMDVYGYWRNLPGLWAIRPQDLKPAGE
jgi:hypoxanthine phosphoribosyltransferase